ncbi:hypothetical protein F3Y22_tig00116971pilonHSYRG00725 [Hibiscus syriacus]|uniref:Uncharacterized protein n=1 Tax=Hibiscus syriacus TaxID=106335 RepID=A0A6A2XJ88_HIBSY|nr:hypothetical protein F3Y22_tig00116971pilonHSYRG00725 [Hibiscus syriacus]
MLNEPLLTSPSTPGPLNLHNNIFAMDHTDADNVKPTEECHEVHNVDESNRLVGQLLSSRDQAWYFYKGFVREHGFSARKGTTRLDVEGNLKTQEFCCSKEGFQVSKGNTVDRQRAYTPVTRTRCKARVIVTTTNLNDHWVITVSKADIDEATTLKEVGVGTSQVMNYLTQQAGGYHNVGFIHKDLYNALQRGKSKEIIDGDVNALIAYFDYKKYDDPGFFMTYSVDESGALHNLIWLDSTSRSDYTCFDDVIAFDTTYKDNLYGRPIMPIVGVNHHHNTIVFATAIIADETSQYFEWVLQNFLEAMMNKSPISVVTDEDRAMQRAIKSVIPYHLDYTYLPGTLIQSRWTKDAKASAPNYVDLNVPPEMMQMVRFIALRSTSINQSIVVNNVRDPQRKQHKRKEVPKNKVEKKIRRCGYCNSEGHNKLTCPQVKLSLNTSTQLTSTDFFEDGMEWPFSPARDDNDLHIS